MSSSSYQSIIHDEPDDRHINDPEPKRMKTEPRKAVSPSRYKEHKMRRQTYDIDADASGCVEFATLSTGKTILLSETMWNVPDDRCKFEKYEHGFNPKVWARVPGYDLMICSMEHYAKKSDALCLGVFTLPDLLLTSTLNISIRTKCVPTKKICTDSTSVYGIGRVVISTSDFLFLIDITSEGLSTITNILDKYACEAIYENRYDLECIRTERQKNFDFERICLYHDSSGKPIVIISSDSARVVFVSMSGLQCIPNTVFSHIANGVNYVARKTPMRFMQLRPCEEYYPNIDMINYLIKRKTVKPLRVIFTEDGTMRTKIREKLSILAMAIWEPISGGGKKLITVATDNMLSISNIENGKIFSNEILPYKFFLIGLTLPKKSNDIILVVHGDTAFTMSRYDEYGRFSDLSTESPSNIVMTRNLSGEDPHHYFHWISACFSERGVLAFFCSNFSHYKSCYVMIINPSQ